ncbi:MAG: hypothetical protein PHQ12_11955 [Chthoniobacteraceae bacterium]|nr:hypothetical protein [Chthoniobacteraceae bacterium]
MNERIDEVSGDEEFNPSSVYFAAAIAAENALPEQSRALINKRDELHRLWGKAGWPVPVPPDLLAAGQAVEADPLANFAMELRRRGNEAFIAETSTPKEAEVAA